MTDAGDAYDGGGLSEIERDFISHFGEMGSRWGVNRTVGQIYALLYISEKPLHAEEISEVLHISRSNVSTGLKELDAWRLTRVRHIKGDRKDYFTVPEDIWEIVRTLADERKKREVDPTLSVLRDLLLRDETENTAYARKKMTEMSNLIELFAERYNDLQKMTTEELAFLVKAGSKLLKLYNFKDKINPFSGKIKPEVTD